MKKRICKVMVLLLVGLVMFTSCKHKGLPVSKGLVQIVYTFGGFDKTYEIPVELYDVLFEEFDSLIGAYNSDMLLNEERLEEMDDFSFNLRHFDEDNLLEELSPFISSKSINSFEKKIEGMTNGQEANLLELLGSMSYTYDYFLEYLVEIADIDNGVSYYDSKFEFIKDLKKSEDYFMFDAVMKMFFPEIEIIKK